MEAVLAVLPELVPVGPDPQPAPPRRPGNRPSGKLGLHLVHLASNRPRLSIGSLWRDARALICPPRGRVAK